MTHQDKILEINRKLALLIGELTNWPAAPAQNEHIIRLAQLTLALSREVNELMDFCATAQR